MNEETKNVKVQHSGEGIRERITGFAEGLWDKISHHGNGVPAAADLAESNNVLTYNLELPGMDENDVEVSVEAGHLLIRGEKRDELEEKGDNFIFRGRSFGKFERAFALPASAKDQDISASFSKGVLTVSIPCSEPPTGEPRRIEVSGG